MRIKLAVLFLLVMSVTTASCMTSETVRPQADLEASFDRIIDSANKWDLAGSSNSQPFSIYNHPDYRLLINKIWNSKDDEERRAYRSVLMEELVIISKPEYKALSCALLGEGFDVNAIPQLGRLLDDTAESLPQFYPPIVHRQPAPTEAVGGTVRKAAVREFASRSLFTLTGQSFSSRSEFDKWWRENSHYKNTAWYWRGQWDPANGPQATVAQRVRDMWSFSDELMVRVLFLSDINWDEGASYEALTKFMKKRSYGFAIIPMLQQKNLPPDISSQDRFDFFVRRVSHLSLSLFTSADEPQIAQAQEVNSPYKAPIADLVLIRSNITFPQTGSDPRCRVLPLKETDKPVTILTEALQKDPKLVPVAIELISVIGAKKADVLKRSFESVSIYEKREIAQAVATNASWMTPAFIRQLVQLLPNPKTSNYSDGGLGYLGRATNEVLHRQVISDKEISQVELQMGKTTSSKETEQAAMHFAKLKQRLLQVLAKA